MKNQQLFNKYRDGNHWENHPTDYIKEFIFFLSSYTDVLRFIKFDSEYSIIDLGCGNGRDVYRLLDYYYKPAIGLDNNPDTIKKAIKKTNKDAFYVQDIENLSFGNESQIAYFCINVMHYVDAPKVLSEIYRTLKPGGYAFIHFNLLIIDQNYTIDYHQTRSDVYELIKQFTIVEEKIFLREDALPQPHVHHIMQVIIKKN